MHSSKSAGCVQVFIFTDVIIIMTAFASVLSAYKPKSIVAAHAGCITNSLALGAIYGCGDGGRK
jgi:hypothetical protein